MAIVLLRYGLGLQASNNAVLVAYGAGGLALFGGLFWLNRRVGRTRYQPEVERLEALLADFDRPR